MKRFLFILALTLSLVSCEQLKYGNVVERHYEPEYTSIMLMPMVISTGKSTTTILVPFFIHHNESWVIQVKGEGTKGNTITKKYYIDEAAYDTMTIGKFICVKGMCSEDTATHKTRQ